jgi:hypothetical protein
MANFKASFEIDLDDGIKMYRTSMASALQALGQKGFAQIQAPTYVTQGAQVTYRGEIPHDLTVLSDTELGYYMGLLAEWNAFVQFQLAEADTQLLHFKSELALTEAKLRLAFKYDEENKKRSNPERDDLALHQGDCVRGRAILQRLLAAHHPARPRDRPHAPGRQHQHHQHPGGADVPESEDVA